MVLKKLSLIFSALLIGQLSNVCKLHALGLGPLTNINEQIEIKNNATVVLGASAEYTGTITSVGTTASDPTTDNGVLMVGHDAPINAVLSGNMQGFYGKLKLYDGSNVYLNSEDGGMDIDLSTNSTTTKIIPLGADCVGSVLTNKPIGIDLGGYGELDLTQYIGHVGGVTGYFELNQGNLRINDANPSFSSRVKYTVPPRADGNMKYLKISGASGTFVGASDTLVKPSLFFSLNFANAIGFTGGTTYSFKIAETTSTNTLDGSLPELLNANSWVVENPGTTFYTQQIGGTGPYEWILGGLKSSGDGNMFQYPGSTGTTYPNTQDLFGTPVGGTGIIGGAYTSNDLTNPTIVLRTIDAYQPANIFYNAKLDIGGYSILDSTNKLTICSGKTLEITSSSSTPGEFHGQIIFGSDASTIKFDKPTLSDHFRIDGGAAGNIDFDVGTTNTASINLNDGRLNEKVKKIIASSGKVVITHS